jgi:predicted dehydrogenase
VRPHSSAGGGGEETAGWEAADLIAAEHAAFAAAVLDGAPVLVDGAAGRRALEAALRVEQAASG